MNKDHLKVSKFSIIVTAGAFYIVLNMASLIFFKLDSIFFHLIIVFVALIAGVLMGLEKKSNRMKTSVMTAIISTIFLFLTSISASKATLILFVIMLIEIGLPMILMTWVVSTIKKR